MTNERLESKTFILKIQFLKGHIYIHTEFRQNTMHGLITKYENRESYTEYRVAIAIVQRPFRHTFDLKTFIKFSVK